MLTSVLRSADAATAGISKHQLAAMQASGEVVQPFRGVYLAAGVSDDPLARARALACVLPPGAAACRETAAWIHGTDARPPGQHREPVRLECLVPVGMARRRHHGLRCFESTLSSSDVAIVNGVPTTTPLRTALDLARYSPAYMALGCVDDLAHRGLVQIDALAHLARRLPGQRGIARARQVIEWADARTESFGESWLRLRLLQAGLPRPDVQIEITDVSGRVVFRLDSGYPEARVGIEYDGDQFHYATTAQRQHDEARRSLLKSRFGWDVVGAHRGDVLGMSPQLERAVAEMVAFEGVLFGRQHW